jgi:pSer/pThr/pTyr-binding forkhead associated (FHA) protein
MASLQCVWGHSPIEYWPGDIELQAPETVIGRSLPFMAAEYGAASAVFLDCFSLARAHARFALEGGVWYVEDLRTPNRTYVNEVMVVGRAPLRDGDKVRVPGFVFVFRDPQSGE